jgi:hypothetical protein
MRHALSRACSMPKLLVPPPAPIPVQSPLLAALAAPLCLTTTASCTEQNGRQHKPSTGPIIQAQYLLHDEVEAVLGTCRASERNSAPCPMPPATSHRTQQLPAHWPSSCNILARIPAPALAQCCPCIIHSIAQHTGGAAPLWGLARVATSSIGHQFMPTYQAGRACRQPASRVAFPAAFQARDGRRMGGGPSRPQQHGSARPNFFNHHRRSRPR